MAENNKENITKQDGEQAPNKDSNGKFVAGNNANPEGKGGFGDNPDNINTEGRAKGWTWREMLEGIALEIAPIEVDGKSVTFKEAVGQRLWLEAMNGNIAAMKELFTRMEGLPRLEVDLRGKIDTGSDKIAELLQLMYEQANKDSKEDSSDVLPE